MQAKLFIALWAGACVAAPVHVAFEGSITAIPVDSLGIADSLGLRVGAPVAYEMDLDYGLQPSYQEYGSARSIPDTLDVNGRSTDYFQAAFLSPSFTRDRQNDSPVVILDLGQVQRAPGSPTVMTLGSYRAWGLPSGDPGSSVIFAFPGEDGKLADTSKGQGLEVLQKGNSTLFYCTFNITRVTLSTPISVVQPLAGLKARGPNALKKERGAIMLPLGKRRFLINGKGL